MWSGGTLAKYFGATSALCRTAPQRKLRLKSDEPAIVPMRHDQPSLRKFSDSPDSTKHTTAPAATKGIPKAYRAKAWSTRDADEVEGVYDQTTAIQQRYTVPNMA